MCVVVQSDAICKLLVQMQEYVRMQCQHAALQGPAIARVPCCATVSTVDI